MQNKQYLTQEKYNELQEELHFLIHKKRQEVAQHLEYAKSMGDLSENAEYQEARDEQGKVESRISQIEDLLKHAEILQHKKSDVVEAGSKVVIQKNGEKEKKEFLLVGSEEADMAAGKLSYDSPLGEALMKKKKGDAVSIDTPKGRIEYKIISVE
ncbi:MAG: transcription elongation factor GreA [Candidatus Pacebacteria bacterium]|nr:transcription elongation factor GreA [Candidatus Paceibacterota bacterium]